MMTADNHAYNRLSCQIGDVTVLTRTTLDATQIAGAAMKELGAFLFAINEVFGSDTVQKAADLWVRRLETTDWMGTNKAKAFRRITIQTSAQLADDFTLQSFLQVPSEVSNQDQNISGAK
jgi:hypothetical protein